MDRTDLKSDTELAQPRSGPVRCACWSIDAHNCWALRYHGHTGVSELTIDREGGPCECDCHEIDRGDEDLP